jgi:Domain of unknown function (DUF4359)
MKKLSFATLTTLVVSLGLVLALTNPKQKGHYVSHVAHDFQLLCCQGVSGLAKLNCQRGRPIMVPLVKGVIYAYTDEPQNFVLFTWYTTYLPGQTIYGLGIGGKFIIWPHQPIADNACGLLHETLLGNFQ